jgi:thiol-disulfide isomerase/thioredoxin
MKKRVGIISTISFVAFAAAIAVVTVTTSSPEKTALPDDPEIGASAGVQLAQTGDDAEAAYADMVARLLALESKARDAKSADEQMDVIRQMDVLLSEFIDQYDGSPQAAEASFEAGMVSLSLQKTKKAIRYLEGYLQNAVDPQRDKQAYAHFYLAEAYKSIGEFDDAEAEYKLVLGSFGDVDRRLSDMAAQNMRNLDNERKLKVGSPPIGFQVTTIKGERLSLEQYKGKVVLLDFWATWCVPCRQEMPNVINVYEKYNKKGFEIVGISLDRSRDDLDRYLDKYDVEWPQYFDGKFWKNDVATLYGIQSIPATFLIDKKGLIRYKSLRGRQLQSAVEELLAE